MPVSFRNSRVSWFVTCVFVASALWLAAAPADAQMTFLSTYNFSATNSSGDNTDGADPIGVIAGSDGNFYGTTAHGGASGDGTVFKVTSAGALITLVNFNGADGDFPSGTLFESRGGNIYGTTYYGGAYNRGTVFQVTPAGALTTLVSFNGVNGSGPFGALIEGSDGNVYGTTQYGGASISPNNPSGDGTIFKVTPTGALTTLCSFTNGNEGASLSGALAQGSDGNFYGTAGYGGAYNRGTVFQVTPSGVLTVLVNFNGTNGTYPGGLLEGNDGNLYGTTGEGTNEGTIFKLTLAGTLTTLDTFTGGNAGPPSSLIEGADGNFYGTTAGIEYGFTGETIFKLTPAGALTTLYTFTGGSAGAPSNLIEGNDGNFYGTAYRGGASGDGTVFGLFGPPTTFGASETAYENTPLAFTVAFNDPSGNGISSVAFPTPPAHGTLAAGAITETGSTGTVALTYTPAAGYTGADNFTYTVTSNVVGTSSPQTVTLTIVGPPTIASFAPSSGPVGTNVVITGMNFTGTQSVTFNGTAAMFMVNSAAQITATVPTSATTGVIDVQMPGGLAVSAMNFTIIAPPTVSLTAGTQTSTTASFTATATSGDGSALTYRWSVTPSATPGFASALTGSAASGAAFTNMLTVGAAGTYTVPVTVTDAYGQTAAASQAVTFSQVLTTVTVSPATVSVPENGTQSFTATVTDQFGTVFPSPSLTWSVSGGGSINAATDVFTAGKTPGTYTVTAATTSNGVTRMGTASVTVVNITPTITGFTPASGPAGTVVTITGTNLTGTSLVGFQGQHAKTFTVNGTGTQITATVPAGAVTGPMAVLTPGGIVRSATNFTVTVAVPKPTITGFTPASGPAGTVVTITGTNLTGTSLVGFQGQHAKTFTVNGTGTQITATVPAGAVTGPMAVLTPGGIVRSATNFTVTP